MNESQTEILISNSKTRRHHTDTSSRTSNHIFQTFKRAFNIDTIDIICMSKYQHYQSMETTCQSLSTQPLRNVIYLRRKPSMKNFNDNKNRIAFYFILVHQKKETNDLKMASILLSITI